MIKVKDAIDPNEVVVEFYDEEGVLDEATRLTNAEARELMNELYDYYENKDREALARYLTRGNKPGTL